VTFGRQLGFLITLGLISGLASVALSAEGHDASTYFTKKWAVGDRAAVPWRFTSDFPETQKRDRVQDG